MATVEAEDEVVTWPTLPTLQSARITQQHRMRPMSHLERVEQIVAKQSEVHLEQRVEWASWVVEMVEEVVQDQWDPPLELREGQE